MKKGLAIIFTLLAVMGFSRDENAWKAEKTLDKQYTVFKDNLRFYGGYYLLEDKQITEYRGALKDSIFLYRKIVEANTTEINAKTKEIAALKTELASVKKELDTAYLKVDSISSFWGETSKGAFSGTMYTITFLLLCVIGATSFLFIRSNNVTVEITKNLRDTEAAFEEHRKRSLEKEMKLNRELQTERNKHL